MKKYKIGYTQGTFDLFHIGHLNLLNHAKQMCDYLIVGVNSDDLVKSYKNKIPVVPQDQRALIVGSIKYVDQVLVAETLDKLKILKENPFDVIVIGSDWKGNKRWKQTTIDLNKFGIDVIYLPHTDGISSTYLLEKIKKETKNE